MSRRRKSKSLLAFSELRPWLRDWRVVSAGILIGLAWTGWKALQPSPEELAVEGQMLFVHEWTRFDELSEGGDGLGPVFNARSCVACHFQGGAGGAGGNEHNVLAYETLPSRNDRNVHGGVVHAHAIEGVSPETRAEIREMFPIVKGGARVVAGCYVNVTDFDPVVFHEINTPPLFGSGAIDNLSGWAIRRAHLARRAVNVAAEVGGDFKRTPAGRVRILPDGRVGKFGWKAQFATLEEFVATACAVEVGLSNPIRQQDVPHEHRPACNVMPDMNSRQLNSLIAFCALLDTPRREFPSDPTALQEVVHGETLFTKVGCADCHTPDIGGIVGVYSDFCLHSVADPESETGYGSIPEVPLPDNLPAPDEWKTPPLWGVADSAPYLHDGSAPTLEAAIDAHSGEARHVLHRYRNDLNAQDREAVIAFLRTLRAPVREADQALASR